jgi:hypothetical protein
MEDKQVSGVSIQMTDVGRQKTDEKYWKAKHRIQLLFSVICLLFSDL